MDATYRVKVTPRHVIASTTSLFFTIALRRGLTDLARFKMAVIILNHLPFCYVTYRHIFIPH